MINSERSYGYTVPAKPDGGVKSYRGIKSREFSYLTPQMAAELEETWLKSLKRRAIGDFSYPEGLNERIFSAAKTPRYRRQYFTDRREIAMAYARSHRGLLVEIEVPLKEILASFAIEFQNFALRKKKFEIVYSVESRLLMERGRRWKLRVHDLSAPAAGRSR